MRKTLVHLAIILAIVMTGSVLRAKNVAGGTPPSQQSIVILFENDVHCAIEKYPVFAGYRDAVADTAMTVTVSCGDFVQGSTPGALSKGQYCIDIMKKVGYDAVTLGNHEFDYNMPRMKELLSQLGDSIVVSANLVDYDTRDLVYQPFLMKEKGGKKIAILGATTPGTLETETYAFYDQNSKQLYDLMDADFFGMVQGHVDAARAQGADYVVVISHLGEDPTSMGVDSHSFIANTTGIDVVLDGHTHQVVQPMTLQNKNGEPVYISQTGYMLKNIGKMVIRPDGGFTMELVPTAGLTLSNAEVQAAVDSVKNDMQEVVSRVVCHSDYDLRVSDGNGDDIGRRSECNAGNLVCDAFRVIAGADVAVTNAGGVRNDLLKGDITYGDIINMMPYDNYLCLAELPGSMILEMLRANTAELPINDGQFPQVSGLKFTAVVSDHSVRDVEVLNSATGLYEPLDPDKTYTIATTDYCLYNGGLRNTLKESKLTRNAIINYRDSLIEFITKHLNGEISQEYAAPQGRITVVQE